MTDKKTFGSFIRTKRTEKNLSQKDLAEELFVTEGAVSKWERGVSYPDITLVPDICRVLEISEHEQSITDFFTGAGTGIVVSCLFSPNSAIRTAAILVGLAMIGIGWYRKAVYDKKVIQFLNEHQDM